MKYTTTPIVVVAYNRPTSLKRLLLSLSAAYYPNEQIPLIISIDYANNNNNVVNIARDFEWDHGTKKVKTHATNLGLRKHVLECGAYASEYGSVIILEDDLIVSPHFYNYTIDALNFSHPYEYINGVSLYKHQTNVHRNLDFNPVEDGCDNWYFQFASSWGQAYTRHHWERFLEWYETDPDLTLMDNLPDYVKNWSKQSWLKYFIAFLIETNSFFLYPRHSLTTNFADVGTHVGIKSYDFQVPLLFTKSKDITFNFSEIDQSMAVYDAHFENVKLGRYFKDIIDDNQLEIDLYGYKRPSSKRFFLSSQRFNYKILKKFSRSLKPIEMNIIMNLEGDNIFLYDTTIHVLNNYPTKTDHEITYFIKGLTLGHLKSIAKLYYHRLIVLFKNKLGL